MTPERFCDWLQGYVELDGETPTQEQWEMIKEHLSLVYIKVTSTKEELLEKKELPGVKIVKKKVYCSNNKKVC